MELHFLKRIVLEAGEGEYSQGVVCHGIHAELKEGKEAIRQGKKVKEAGIKLIHNQNEWEFTFKADTFNFQSLKLSAQWIGRKLRKTLRETFWSEFTLLKMR